ncbi:DUF2606 family protein [Flavobacterium sp.]|uniref:DUF2606 family protein n=1 Tax=Flavobacterium sp. TaxID=239 RepID=UPI00286E15F1|nr:DUF2606 family protein [Flavobacterium sp.]
MKQIILLICLLFLVTSCEIQYDGETKIVVTGKIIDENGNPISNKNIDITIYSDDPYTPSDLISFGKSDQNGNFTLIFPTPQGEYNFSISVNNMQKETNEFHAIEIIADKNNFENYKLELKNITLYKKESITTLRLLLNKTSTNKQLTSLQIDGKQFNDLIVLNPIDNNPNNLQTYYNVLKNQTIIVKYTIIDYSNNGSTVQSISIPIANDEVNYTITY